MQHVAFQPSPTTHPGQLTNLLPCFETDGQQLRRSHRHFAAGQSIFLPGEPASGVYRVVSGTVLVSRYLADGRRQILDIVQPGQLFGFNAGRHDCQADAVSASVIALPDPHDTVRTNSMAEVMQNALLREIAHLREMAVLLGRKSALERVATLLMQLAGDRIDRTSTLVLQISRTDIADYLGLRIETVSRSLGQLKKAGLISISDYVRVTLREPLKLHRLAEGLGL